MFQTTKQLPKGDDLLALCSGGTVPMISPWYCDMAVSVNGGTPKWLKIRKIMWKNWWKWGVPHNLGCVLFWLVSVTPWKSRFLPSKSRKVHMPGDFGSKSRKIRKNRKVEKSKNSKNSKSRKLFGFLTFCENFPWKSDKPRGVLEALEHRQYPRTGLFMVVWLLFPGRMVGYFPGEQETCNQCICIRIRFCVAHVISGFLYFFVLVLWVLKAGYWKPTKLLSRYLAQGHQGHYCH